MCNLWTGEHVFMWSGSTTLNQEPSHDVRCKCNLLTYGEAKQIALDALIAAEKRRQEEREAEADYWRGM